MKKMFAMFILVLFMVPTVSFADGAGDYQARCAVCHGVKGNLVPRTAERLKVDAKKLSLKSSTLNREAMIAMTEKGKDKMPSFEKVLTKEQITAIIDYVQSLKKAAPKK